MSRSRCIDISIQEQSTTKCLIPFTDMFNHATSNCQATLNYDFKRKALTAKAIQNIKTDGEICINYDRGYSNYESFLNYGFLESMEVNGGLRLTVDEC